MSRRFRQSRFSAGLSNRPARLKTRVSTKRRFGIDPALPGRLADRLPFAEFLQEESPLVLVVQSRKGRLHPRIEDNAMVPPHSLTAS